MHLANEKCYELALQAIELQRAEEQLRAIKNAPSAKKLANMLKFANDWFDFKLYCSQQVYEKAQRYQKEHNDFMGMRDSADVDLLHSAFCGISEIWHIHTKHQRNA